MTVGGQIIEQASELNEMADACLAGQWWLLFAHRAKPTEEMGIATELREMANMWEGRTEIGQEATCGRTISLHCVGLQGKSQRLHLSFEDLFERGSGWPHEKCSDPNF